MPEVVVTYLEMRSEAELKPKRSSDPAFTVRECAPADGEFNRELYFSVGAPWEWKDKRGWTPDQWQTYAAAEGMRTFGAYHHGELAGYFELMREQEDVQIAYFGLLPSFIGQGLGGALLTKALEEAWAMKPKRVWVHTCSLDHPSALPNYIARGFRPYKREVYESSAPQEKSI